ncbi:elongation factor P 2 [Planctomyces bekefii]|uniref:Elongation factor P n=1 Tax=Planctomyces bekefii TaxID=1653850 RepID=A0A5C6MB88_9PLAN|nr:elongation factor P 2 [Planctomyces bekefii]
MISTTDFKKGVKIEYNDAAWVIVDFQHINPGKGAAFTRTKIKNLETSRVVEVNFKSGEKVGVPDVQTREMQYLYNDGSSYSFMDQESFDQFSLTTEEIGDGKDYLIENMVVSVTYYKGRPVAVDLPNFVELKVAETQPNIRGDTSGGGGKPAKMETGVVVTVPFHIKEGDLLKIDTRTGEYIERVNK